MNDEPAGWRIKLSEGNYVYSDKPYGDAEPLYNHPANTLTDEEIAQVWKNMPPDNDSVLAFARAILRKAQEK